MRGDVAKHTSQFKILEEITEYIVEAYTDNDEIVEEISDRVKKVKEPLEDIPKKLDEREKQLQSYLTSTRQLQDDTDDLSRWLTKMEKALNQQSPISAEKDTSVRQLNDHNYIHDEISRYVTFVLSLSLDLP